MCLYPQDAACLAIQDGNKYFPVNCTKLEGYACMLPALCPDRYNRKGANCYRYVARYHQTGMDYAQYITLATEAQKNCQEDGGALARPKSMQEVEEMVAYFRVSIYRIVVQ